MKAAYERPTTTPVPLPTIYIDWREEQVQSETILITLCPFCMRGFQPAWDCRLASCQHAYHSWCALTHFQRVHQMHSQGLCHGNAQRLVDFCRDPKPQLGKDGLLLAAPWERAPLTRNAILPSLILCQIYLHHVCLWVCMDNLVSSM